MPLQTVAVTVIAHLGATPINGATVTAALTSLDVDGNSGISVPATVVATTDANGQATLNLWPNTLGKYRSQYVFTIAADGMNRAAEYGPLTLRHEDADGNPITAIFLHELDGDNVGWADAHTIIEVANQTLAAAERATEEAAESAERAKTAVTAAEAEVAKASEHADLSGAYADEAKRQADKATLVSGMDEAEQLIDEALSQRDFMVMSENQSLAIRAANNARWPASGFRDSGKHYQRDYVNEGITTYGNANKEPNAIILGRDDQYTGNVGTSKTPFPVTCIAGLASEMRSVNTIYGTSNYATFPQAPNGTGVYDSSGNCRGSGKASLDLMTDVDPKYGNVAGTISEAVARAFEGSVRNGDFRNGIDNLTANRSADLSVTNGVLTVTGTNGSFYGNNAEFGDDFVLSAGDKVRVSGFIPQSAVGSSAYNRIAISDASDGTGGNQDAVGFTSDFTGYFDEVLTAPVAGTYRVFLFSQNPLTTTYWQSISAKPVTEQVVTHPIDVAGLEYYLEEVTGARREIFPHCIQNQSTTFGDTGIPTVPSTRPDSYFAVYDGQTGIDKGRCVVWDDLTTEQRQQVSNYLQEGCFLNKAENLVNGRGRQRTIRGAGNGDWANTDANISGSNSIAYSSSNLLRPRGAQDGSQDYTPGSVAYSFRVTDSTTFIGTGGQYRGVATAAEAIGPIAAYNGECYFLVMARVQRLNQGLYHLSLNPFGTKKAADNKFWYDTTIDFNTTADCFNPAKLLTASGSIASGVSGRDDGKYYDGIYPSGQGGVNDDRLSCWDMSSPIEASKVKAKVINGTYYGEEKLAFTKVGSTTASGSSSVNYAWVFSLPDMNPSLGDRVSLSTDNWSTVFTGVIDNHTADNTYFRVRSSDGINLGLSSGDPVDIVQTSLTNTTVAGNKDNGFSVIDVIGDPANIIQTPQLAQGWYGYWVPVIPVNGNNTYPFTRKSLDEIVSLTKTYDNGSTWVNEDRRIDNVNNNLDLTDSNGSSVVGVFSYTTSPSVTKPSIKKPVYGGEKGLMGVWTFKGYSQALGSLFAESMIGKVCTDSQANVYSESLIPFRFGIDVRNGEIYSDPQYQPSPSHAPITLGVPSNNSPAVKVLTHQIAVNQRQSLSFLWNELAYTQGKPDPWGDTEPATTYTNAYGWMQVGSGTYNNRNNRELTYGINELSKPYGWGSNHTRAGEQVEGVDL